MQHLLNDEQTGKSIANTSVLREIAHALFSLRNQKKMLLFDGIFLQVIDEFHSYYGQAKIYLRPKSTENNEFVLDVTTPAQIASLIDELIAGQITASELLNDSALTLDSKYGKLPKLILFKNIEDHSIIKRAIKALLVQLIECVLDIRHLLLIAKKLRIELARLQYLASHIHNRVSLSPSPQRREPPVGGVKIGGELRNFFRHVAETLYLKIIFVRKQATQNSPFPLAGT